MVMGKDEVIQEVAKRVKEVLAVSLCDGFNLYSENKISVKQNFRKKKHDIVFEIGLDYNR